MTVLFCVQLGWRDSDGGDQFLRRAGSQHSECSTVSTVAPKIGCSRAGHGRSGPTSCLFETGLMSATLLKAGCLACLRSGRLVFAGLSFRLNAGEALVLTGPNGSGKSSLLRLVAGLVPAFRDAGTGPARPARSPIS